MDAVPRLFIERVGLRLDRWSLRESCKIASNWGKRKLYAAAQLTCPLERDWTTSLSTVNMKFITNFDISPLMESINDLPNSWKEITPDELQSLVNRIKPTREGIHPVRYDHKSSSHVMLLNNSTHHMGQKLMSMRLPVDAVTLVTVESAKEKLEEFLEGVGPLYYINAFAAAALKQSIVDTTIDKFVPIDNGKFSFLWLGKAQLEKLVVKCEMAEKKVVLVVNSEEHANLLDFFDF
uniref:Uncharacterized protein n=1 Tax=Steinernema glaseri TaxID=37863 RepID=A0A1I7Y105_9BILA